MRHRPSTRQRRHLAILALAAAVLISLAVLPERVVAEGFKTFMPMVMSGSERPLVAPPTQAAPPTTGATATHDPRFPTNTLPPPTRTARPTNTPLPTDTPGPSPTPTLTGGQVEHPTGTEAVVIQFGWMDEFAGYFSDVWEEMNATPWLTVYGDGRIIASKGLPNREQDLLVGQLDEYTMQLWLRTLAYDAQYFALGDEYLYPGNPKGHLLAYVRVDDGTKRLKLAGWRSFERRPVAESPDMPSSRISAVIRTVRMMETWINENLSEPFSPTDYTLIVQEEKYINPGFPLPRWPHNINLRAIADAAPTAASNYLDRVPGHYFANQAVGEELRAIVVPEADRTWDTENRAAMFTHSGRNYVVGVRQEIPGTSLFLPDRLRQQWYRKDEAPRPPEFFVGAAAVTDTLRPLGLPEVWLTWPPPPAGSGPPGSGAAQRGPPPACRSAKAGPDAGQG